MSYTYGDPRSTRNHFREPRGLMESVLEAAKDAVSTVLPARILQAMGGRRAHADGEGRGTRRGWRSGVFGVVLLLQVLWVWTVYKNERVVFTEAVGACQWRSWEQWPVGAQPHHVALIADPQLVDPHTYPGRPWPLSTLTVRYTDLYMKRVYTLLQQRLYPDSTVFLGDLFDGGREWSVATGESWNNPDKAYKGYGDKFWLKEYRRFGKMFFDGFMRTGVLPRKGQLDRRRIMTSLPGNHDLGFAGGVHLPVRHRFEAYFGEGNRVDVFGNHTFVSIDGVSLSAKDSPEDGAEQIWRPTFDFLEGIQESRKKATTRALHHLFGRGKSGPKFSHELFETKELPGAQLPKPEGSLDAKLPTILLSHVPLYRDPGTPCGPLRERHPPTEGPDGRPLEKDDRNAITVAAGYQYQNVLSHDLTHDITTKIGDVSYAFSGDDHDYCDVRHRRYPSAGGGIREITVKSLSWAMGVRKPGFVMLSLWNPVDEAGNTIAGVQSAETLQARLCLLPDQLALFIRYGILLAFTLAVLSGRAAYLVLHPESSAFAGAEAPILPVVRQEFGGAEVEEGVSSSSSSDEAILDANSFGTRSRATTAGYSSTKRSVGYGGLPSDIHSEKDRYEENHGRWDFAGAQQVKGRRRRRGFTLFWAELKASLLAIICVAGPWYLYLVWMG